jgi:hypothetical protein
MAKSSLIVMGIVLIIIGALLRSGLIQWLLDFMGILLLIIGGITLIVGLVQMITGRSKGY